MRLQDITIFFFTLFTFSLFSQNMANYTGSWEGKIENSKSFNFTITIENLQFEYLVFTSPNSIKTINAPFPTNAERLINQPCRETRVYRGEGSDNGTQRSG